MYMRNALKIPLNPYQTIMQHTIFESVIFNFTKYHGIDTTGFVPL